MKIHFYTLGDHVCDVVPAERKRDWMEAYGNQHPYRCLPLAIANTFGWQLLCPCDLEIKYNGGTSKDDIKIRSLDGSDITSVAESNFSRGVVTFFTNYIFQTEPGWQLFATGPLNEPKDGVYPLSGIIETDWLPYPFTMNWQLTHPGTFTFKKGEPFCQIFAIPKDYIEEAEPEIYRLEDNIELLKEKEAFQASRTEFRARMDAGDDEALKQGWQRYYFKGKTATGQDAPVSHTHKLRVKTPVDKRGTAVENLFVTKKPKKFKFIQTVHEVKKAGETVTPEQRTQIKKPAPAIIKTPPAGNYNSPEEYPFATNQDMEDYGFFYLQNFLKPEECDEIIQTFERNKENTAKYDNEFFNNRVLWMTYLKENEHKARSIMQQARFVASYQTGKLFKEEARLYDDVPQIVKWGPGMSMPAHADNEHPDGSEHGTPYRMYAGVTYLNEGYEGGDLYFEKLKLRIRPKQGAIILFRGDMSHMHGVTEVKNGFRYTMPMWFSFQETDLETVNKIY